ncbi:uncharacterized protein [Miscanthus floridulus]|uniref:uncharacterized protein n=1 Tax=Miscanthus floridulus TaxID=154761 RepID=UPI00345831B3
MSYKAAVAFAGGDDAVLAKSFIIAAEGDELAWYSMLKPSTVYSWENLRDKILANFKGLAAQSLTSIDLFQCKQMQGETLHDYFQKFVQLKAKAPDVPEEIAIEATIKGLRIGPFAAHLARKKPTSIQQLYDKFEKYCRSDNDLQKRLEEQGQNRQQNNSKNSQKSYANQNASNQKPGQGQVLSIEGQPHPEQGQLPRPVGSETQTRNQGRQGYQGKN